MFTNARPAADLTDGGAISSGGDGLNLTEDYEVEDGDGDAAVDPAAVEPGGGGPDDVVSEPATGSETAADDVPIVEDEPVDDPPADEGTNEAADGAAAADDAVEAAPEAPEVPDEPFEWTGELEKFSAIEAVQALPPNVRESLVKGIEATYKGWQRGYGAKFEKLAGREKTVAAQEARIAERLEKLKENERQAAKWMYGSEDPMADMQARLEEAEKASEAAIEALRVQLEAEHTAKLTEVAAERDTFKTKATTYEEAQAAAAREAEEAEQEALLSYLEDSAPQLLADGNERHLTGFIQVLAAEQPATRPELDALLTWYTQRPGMPAAPAEAAGAADAAATKAKPPPPAAKTPAEPATPVQPPPKSIAAMNMDGADNAGPKGEDDEIDFDALVRRTRKQLIDDGELFGE